MKDKKSTTLKSFQIIRNYGDLNKGMCPLGFEVYRRDRIYVPFYRRFIPCASYDNWFIYEIPVIYAGTPSYMCGCGSWADVAGMSSYKNDASPSGLMLVCHHHATFGKHADGSS